MMVFGFKQIVKADVQRYRFLVEGKLEKRLPWKNLLSTVMSPRFIPVFFSDLLLVTKKQPQHPWQVCVDGELRDVWH